MMVICMMIIAWGLSSCQTKAGLEKKICENLLEQYGMEFACESVGVDGGGAFFVCYPTDDSTLHFDGFADSKTGYISYDTFPGAIIARENSGLMTELLSEELGDIYVYAAPKHENTELSEELISGGNYTVSDLNMICGYPNLFFYIFINTSSNSFIDDPGNDYDVVNRSVEEIVNLYKEEYDWEICVDMHIYYVDAEEMDYAKHFFMTHTNTDHSFAEKISSVNRITLQMGPDDYGLYYKSLRLSRDEYIEEKEKLDEA